MHTRKKGLVGEDIFSPTRSYTHAAMASTEHAPSYDHLGYDTPLFGEQYIEEVEDSLGTHNVIRYRPAEDAEPKWKPSQLAPDQPTRQPGPLFKKLEESIIEEERARLGK